MELDTWQKTPATRLPVDEVHVWRVWLDRLPNKTPTFEQFLAADERDRAARFRFERDRQRFIVRHGLLRMLLGRYLRVEPGALQFVANEFGKPFLSPDYGGDALRFNLSGSQGLALYAFSWRRELGIDVEQVRQDFELELVAERFFSHHELIALRSVPKEGRVTAFFTCWTRKEAYIKAYGSGLSLGLDQFDVSFSPEDEARLLATRHDPGEVVRWKFRHLSPAPGFIGALAVEGGEWRLRCFQVDEL